MLTVKIPVYKPDLSGNEKNMLMIAWSQHGFHQKGNM